MTVKMTCPECGAKAIIIEKRNPADGQTRRRRQCLNKHTFTTKEIEGKEQLVPKRKTTKGGQEFTLSALWR
jgi:transcriptional regulator NrdR family protein